MIGFITSQATAQAVNDTVAAAQTSRDLPIFWLPGMYEIHQGEYTGLWFIPADDDILDTPLHGNPPMTPRDFPEFAVIIDSMGGLDARVNLPAADIAPLEP